MTCSHPNGGACRSCQPSMFPSVEREIAYEAWFIAYRKYKAGMKRLWKVVA